jgi:hypothetical protein
VYRCGIGVYRLPPVRDYISMGRWGLQGCLITALLVRRSVVIDPLRVLVSMPRVILVQYLQVLLQWNFHILLGLLGVVRVFLL